MNNPIFTYDSGTVAETMKHGGRTLISGVRFSLNAGESLALVGETGSGKTMTALSILRLLPGDVSMTGGAILLDGEDLLRRKSIRPLLGTRIVYIPQNGHEYLNPARSVRRHLYDSLKKAGVPAAQRESTALEKLKLAGFDTPEPVLDKYPFELSGGMAQKVTIALSACSDARLILADEPTNGLDAEGRNSFMRLLSGVFPDAAKLIITHDIGMAALCDRTLVFLGGKAMECGPSADVLRTPRHPYTAALLGALVENGMKQTPVYRDAEGDCPFYPRCAKAGPACLAGLETRSDGETEWRCCAP